MAASSRTGQRSDVPGIRVDIFRTETADRIEQLAKETKGQDEKQLRLFG